MKLAGVNTSFVTSYSYTTADDLASVTYPGGRVAEYARNSLGQVTAVTTKATSTATPVTVANGVTWLPFGGLKGVTFGNSVVHTSTYDTDYRLTGINAVKSGSAAVQNLALTWNGVDNITAVNDNVATAR
jgi:YD repeat-containing protein